MSADKKKIAFVLAGGGSRGSYQIGVWKALRELGVEPDIVTGTSVGSLTGAIIAQGDYDLAEEVFSNITDEDVMALPADTKNLGALKDFASNLAKKGGIDTAPLENLLRRCIDEKKVRASSVDFGLVTVRKNDFAPIEITLDEMPEGSLVDYMTASASIFPGFAAKKIGEQLYVDGGVFNNLPIALAEDMGADEVIAIDLEAIGIERKYRGMLPVRYICSYWPLGNIVKFDAETARRNIALGYHDGLRAYKKIDGYAYSLKKGSYQKFADSNNVAEKCRAYLEGASLAGKNAFIQLMNYCDAHRNKMRFIEACVENTAEAFEIDCLKIYDSVDELNAEIMKKYRSTMAMEKISDLKHIARDTAVKTMAEAIMDGSLETNVAYALLTSTYSREYASACYIAELVKSGLVSVQA